MYLLSNENVPVKITLSLLTQSPRSTLDNDSRTYSTHILRCYELCNIIFENVLQGNRKEHVVVSPAEINLNKTFLFDPRFAHKNNKM